MNPRETMDVAFVRSGHRTCLLSLREELRHWVVRDLDKDERWTRFAAVWRCMHWYLCRYGRLVVEVCEDGQRSVRVYVQGGHLV